MASLQALHLDEVLSILDDASNAGDDIDGRRTSWRPRARREPEPAAGLEETGSQGQTGPGLQGADLAGG